MLGPDPFVLLGLIYQSIHVAKSHGVTTKEETPTPRCLVPNQTPIQETAPPRGKHLPYEFHPEPPPPELLRPVKAIEKPQMVASSMATRLTVAHVSWGE